MHCSNDPTHAVSPAEPFCGQCGSPVVAKGASITRPFPPTHASISQGGGRVIEAPVMLVVDGTYSVEPIISQVKSNLGEAVEECQGFGVKLVPGLIVVRDLRYNRGEEGLFNYGFMDVAQFKSALGSVRTIGNLTTDESQLDGVLAALRTSWPASAERKVRHIILTTNSGTHNPTEDGVDVEGVVKIADQTGARIHVIGPGKDKDYRRLTDGTGGLLFPVEQLSPEMYKQVFKMLGKTITSTALARA